MPKIAIVGTRRSDPEAEDFVEQLFITTTHHYLMVFTRKGRVYRLKVHEIPEAGRQVVGHVHRVFAQRVQRDHLEGLAVGAGQHHRCRVAHQVGLHPAPGHHTPAVARAQAGEADLRTVARPSSGRRSRVKVPVS